MYSRTSGARVAEAGVLVADLEQAGRDRGTSFGDDVAVDEHATGARGSASSTAAG